MMRGGQAAKAWLFSVKILIRRARTAEDVSLTDECLAIGMSFRNRDQKRSVPSPSESPKPVLIRGLYTI